MLRLAYLNRGGEMRCPHCTFKKTKVLDTREVDDKKVMKRRRECFNCKKRFTTYEKVEKGEINAK